MSETKKVAIVGASGIGKHHANWWNTEGARVCAFVGTSEESVSSTRESLVELFGFDGRGYTDLGALIDEERPGIVDVCSPPEFHYEHAMKGIANGRDVLLEKPFIYDGDLPVAELIDRARALVNEAETGGVRLGMCSQYHVSARSCRRLLKERTGEDAIETYRGEIASPAAGREPDPTATWVDLGPHMLAGIQALAPEGRIDWDTLGTEFEGYGARVKFAVELADGAEIDCELVTDRTTEESESSHVRRFTLNGMVVDIGGERDEEGVYCARYQTPSVSVRRPDPLRLLIREFLGGQPAIDGRGALNNLSRLLRIKEAAT